MKKKNNNQTIICNVTVSRHLSDTTMNLVCVLISGSTNERNLNILNEISIPPFRFRTMFVAAVALLLELTDTIACVY